MKGMLLAIWIMLVAILNQLVYMSTGAGVLEITSLICMFGSMIVVGVSLRDD